ncbi:MAG: M protein trans-acting positive regulator PRD domain-containing protein [Peptoniphilaceae bacterium]|nr:M protein trans-acting positive regulator PRD domain-containing protein [Peptoniphilaceae bacterium]
MRDFLLKNDRKKIRLLLMLYREDVGDGVPLLRLEKALGVSDRGLRTLVQELEGDAEIASGARWFRMEDRLRMSLTPGTSLRAMIQLFFRRLTITEMLLLLLSDESLTVSAMADTLHVSASTIYRLVTQFNAMMQKRGNLRIEVGQMCVTGDEALVRSFYNELLCEVMDPQAFPFPGIAEAAFHEFIERVAEAFGLTLDLYRFQRFRRIVAINFMRYRHGHVLPMTDDLHPRVVAFIQEMAQYRSAFQPFERRLGIAMNEELFFNLFAQYVKKETYLSIDSIVYVPSHGGSANLNDALLYLGQILFQLADEYDMPIDDVRRLLLELHNRMVLEREYGSMSFLFWDPHAMLIDGVRHYYPAFVDALGARLKEYYEKVFGEPTPSIVCRLMVVAIAHWGRFMDKLYDHYGRVSMLVLNSFSSGLVQENVAFLENLFGRLVNISYYDGVYRNDFLTRPGSPHYDIVLSNFAIAAPPGTDVIYFDSIFRPENVKHIYHALRAHFRPKKAGD